MDKFVYFQFTRSGKALVAHITHMFVVGHCSTLMTVGWAWLGSRVCLARKYWQRVLFIFISLKNKILYNLDYNCKFRLIQKLNLEVLNFMTSIRHAEGFKIKNSHTIYHATG
jgi:hypothetical protein